MKPVPLNQIRLLTPTEASALRAELTAWLAKHKDRSVLGRADRFYINAVRRQYVITNDCERRARERMLNAL